MNRARTQHRHDKLRQWDDAQRSRLSVVAMEPMPAIPDDIAGNRDDRYRSHLVTLDDRDPLQVDVAPAHPERLAIRT